MHRKLYPCENCWKLYPRHDLHRTEDGLECRCCSRARRPGWAKRLRAILAGLLLVAVAATVAGLPRETRRVEPRAVTDSWLCSHVSAFFCPIYPTLRPVPTPTPTPRGRKS